MPCRYFLTEDAMMTLSRRNVMSLTLIFLLNMWFNRKLLESLTIS